MFNKKIHNVIESLDSSDMVFGRDNIDLSLHRRIGSHDSSSLGGGILPLEDPNVFL